MNGIDSTDTSNNSPLGDGGKLSVKKAGPSNNSPLWDGGKKRKVTKFKYSIR